MNPITLKIAARWGSGCNRLLTSTEDHICLERSAKKRFGLLILSLIIAVAYAVSTLKHLRVWSAVLLVGVFLAVFWLVRTHKNSKRGR
jgi:Flp pilus assembly protein TadB